MMHARVELATKPVYGNSYVIRNLIDIKNLIEEFLLENKEGPIRKEILPFLCVVNPPRHGKSLLLDSIFVGNESVMVISITYNTGSSFDSTIEINSRSSAIHFNEGTTPASRVEGVDKFTQISERNE
jgi:hypothetical protein